MIQDEIINELQYIPEAKLFELYDLIRKYSLPPLKKGGE